MSREAAALSAIVLTLFSLCFAENAAAWGQVGHELVGDIAQARLTRHARREVARLLNGDLDAEGNPSGRKTLASISTWADEYRRTPAGSSTAPWHYDNWPICASAREPSACPDGQCASRALEREIAILADRNASPRARNEALKWIVHLAGDIHQPLHEADNLDKGGNTVRVTFFGITQDEWGPLNLHGVWDKYLVERLVAQTAGGARAFVRQERRSRKHPDWESGSVTDWMTESHQIGVNVSYPKLPTPQPCNQPTTETLVLNEQYYADTAPIVAMQLRKAGVRLAKVLNAALAR